jgi:phosphoglycerate dehydrogenase-like enzyme
MPTTPERFRIAVLDDYQNVALSLADWSLLDARMSVTVFNDHLANSDAVAERLQPFDIVCVMRERTPMTRAIIERLPKLRLIASTGSRNASIDLKAAEERGVEVVHTGYTSTPTIELTWALILASARNLIAENTSLRRGGWQQSVGDDMSGRYPRAPWTRQRRRRGGADRQRLRYEGHRLEPESHDRAGV